MNATTGPAEPAAGLAAFRDAAASCAREMLDNAGYIEKELGSVRVPSPDDARAIAEICSSLLGSGHDVMSELFEFDEPGLPAVDPVVQRRVERIHRLLGDDLPRLDAVVRPLAAAAKRDSAYGLVSVLVSESAANILRSYARVSAAATAYRVAVGGA
jgi:hypothetical protein